MKNEHWNEEWLEKEDEDLGIDWLLDIFRKAEKASEGNVYLQDPREVERVRKVYRLMKQVTAGQEVSVTGRLHMPFSTVASVSVEGFVPEFLDVERFAEAVRLADNVEVMAKTCGTVQITFGFHGMAKKIGRVDV